MAKGLRDTIGTANALAHYKEQEIFDEAMFKSIDFEPVKMVLATKPKMYNLWYGTQAVLGLLRHRQMAENQEPR